MKNNVITQCRRCGTCCGKGGPALHNEDEPMIVSGEIPLASLYTIRKGELAANNIHGGLIRLPEEIIKIKSRAGASGCVYFIDADKSCEIYDHRPVECRTLECWNTDRIEDMFTKDRLVRRILLKKNPWLIELVETHDSECALDRVQHLADERESGDASATARLMTMINYDVHLRSLMVEKGGISPDMLDFLFGRPLVEIVPRQFGVKISKI